MSLLAAALVLTVRQLSGALPPDEFTQSYNTYAPPPGYQLDIYNVLRHPRGRPGAIQQVLEAMEHAKRDMLSLCYGTRWGEDRTVKFLLYIRFYQRALHDIAVFRQGFADLLEIKARYLVDDTDLEKHILQLREWGATTACVLYEPVYPRHPYVQVERVLLRSPN